MIICEFENENKGGVFIKKVTIDARIAKLAACNVAR